MAEPTLEELFARFADHGDVRALAAVYDRVAAELLLVAAHFGVRAGDAEDLLQATFLAAMESAQAYDRERQLMPWLIGILIHQARREHRVRARKPDPRRLEAPIEQPGPLELAADAEFAAEFAQQLRSLPVGYRQVLTLRWVHGLSPTAIAHTLGLLPETVKTRLRRGAELLRRALPAGFAAALAVMVTPGRGLAAVRAAVLERATELHAARFGAPLLRGAQLAKIGSGLALLLATVAVVVWTGSDPAAAPSPLPRQAPAALTANEAALPPVGGAVPSGRTEVEADPVAAALEIEVRWADATPAPGVWVALVRSGAADPLLAERWLQADTDGRVHCADLADGMYELTGDRGGGAAAEVASGRGRAILTVPTGVLLRGRVVGPGGAALPGAGIWLSREQRFDEGRTIAATDADGRFAVRDVAADRAFSVVADGFVPRPLERVDAGSGELRIDLATQSSGWSLTGVVVDAAGLPVAGALVQIGRRLPFLDFANAAMGGESRVPPLVLVTDGAGRFARTGFLVFDGRVDVWARAPGFTAASASVPLHERQAAVELRLHPGRAVRGRCVGDDGEPVAAARVSARDGALADPATAPRWAAVEACSDADGRYLLAGVREGVQSLAARTADGRRAAGSVDGDGDSRWDPVLRAPRPVAGFVVDTDGAPIAGIQVRGLVGPGRAEPRPAVTDLRGAFVLADCDDGPYTLWVTDPQSPWSGCVASVPDVRAVDPAVTVQVPPHRRATAWLEGRVVDAAGRPLAAAVALGNLRVGRTYADNDPATGRFRIGPLPAVPDWNLFVRDADKRWNGRGDVATAPGAVTDVGDLVLDQPGRAVFTLHGATDAGTAKITFVGGLECDEVVFARGGARTRALPPGEFVLHFLGADVPQSPTPFRIAPGGETQVRVKVAPSAVRTFTFAHPDDGWDLRLDLQWCDAAGGLLCRDQLQLPHKAPLALRQALAAGSYLLLAVSHAGRRAECRFDVVAGAPAPPLHLELRE